MLRLSDLIGKIISFSHNRTLGSVALVSAVNVSAEIELLLFDYVGFLSSFWDSKISTRQPDHAERIIIMYSYAVLLRQQNPPIYTNLRNR